MRSIVAELASASSGELVGAVGAIASELAVRRAPESGVVAMELAESLGRSIDLSEAALAVLVGRVDATGAHGEGGFSSAAAWLRNALGMQHGRAAERVTLAKQLPRLARAGKLLTAGGLSFGFASAICGAVRRLDGDETPVAEDILLEMVEQGLSVGQVTKAGDTITDLVAERQGKDTEPQESRRGFKRSWFSRSKSLDAGSWFKGWLNPEHTAIFDQIIGPLAKPKAQWDDRDLSQRTADALFSVISEGNKGAGLTLIIDLAAYTAANGDAGPFGRTSRTDNGSAEVQDPLDVPASDADAEADAETGTEAETDADAETGAETDADADADAETETDADAEMMEPFITNPTAPGAERVPTRLLDGTPISAADARRIALNAGINALVLGRDGLPLYLGRTVRFATPAQRKALLALYQTCCVRGCQIPAHLSEIHHLDGGWKLGSLTDIDKLAMLCGWHNRWIETHQDRVVETRDSRGRAVLQILPPWHAQREGATGRPRGQATTSGRRPGVP